MKIFLIGMPGCGKSTLGKQLAGRLSLPFLDLDKEIEHQEKATVSTLFNTRGENFFREKERDRLILLCKRHQDFVMATGGGTPCFFSNMKRIHNAGISFFLNVPVEELFCRLRYVQAVSRPLLSDDKSRLSIEKIAELYTQRLNTYQQANFTCKGNRINADVIIEKIAPLIAGES